MGSPGSIDDIRPFAQLAQTATTSVYKAYQASLERFVLLKRLRPTVSSDEDLAARFQEEARIAARIQHPNVVSIYAFGKDDDGAYIVAEYVEGLDLSDLIARSRIPPDIALFILRQAALGLQAAHEKGVLHRDLKPSNILISRGGEVKLSDFGLASVASAASGSTEVRGTLAYLSPEQILESEADERTDIFALGATFYEMLTGRRAFPGTTHQEIFDAVLNRDPLPFLSATAGIDDGLVELCAWMLARDRDDRSPSAGHVVEAVESHAGRRHGLMGAEALAAFVDDPSAFEVKAEVDAPPGPPEVKIVASADEFDRSGRRRWKGAAAAAVVLCLGVVMAYAGMVYLRAPDDEASTATTMETAAESPEVDSMDAQFGDGPSAEPLSSLAVASDSPPVREEERADEPTAPLSVRPDPPQENAPEEVLGVILLSADTAATVFLGADSIGTVRARHPIAFAAAPGEHRVRVRNAAFPLEARDVRVEPSETTRVDVSLWATVGRLELQVSPWANVYVDGRSVGQTPLRDPLILLPGVREIRLVNPQMGVEHSALITVPRGETVQRRFDLYNLK